MISILTNPARTAPRILIIAAAFVTAAVVVLVLALSVWSAGGTDTNPAPHVVTSSDEPDLQFVRPAWPCKLEGPC
ncbi:MAG: hypothetical protein ABWZ15_05000 [Acidimicrobiia bacterium]